MQLVIHIFCYCNNIHVDTHGVTLLVSVQSSYFLDEPPGYTASLRHLLINHYLLLPRVAEFCPHVEPITSTIFRASFRGFILALYNIPCSYI